MNDKFWVARSLSILNIFRSIYENSLLISSISVNPISFQVAQLNTKPNFSSFHRITGNSFFSYYFSLLSFISDVILSITSGLNPVNISVNPVYFNNVERWGRFRKPDDNLFYNSLSLKRRHTK